MPSQYINCMCSLVKQPRVAPPNGPVRGREARPDFAELDVFLGQWDNILIQKCNLDHFPTPKPKLNRE